MKKIIKRDMKKFGILLIIYLVLQYLAIFLIEEVGNLLTGNINFLLEYFYYFLMVLAVVFLSLGTFLLIIYFIFKPALEDKQVNVKLDEKVILYRFLSLLFAFFISLFNFFIALSIISDFDIMIIFQQSIHFYIAFNFGIEVVLSIILIIYNKIYNNKFFANKINIILNLILVVIIYLSGNLYYFYYFKYGMLLLLLGYGIIFLNIFQICKKVFVSFSAKVCWFILLILLLGLEMCVLIKGENMPMDSYVGEDVSEGKVYETEEKYSYKIIDSKFGEIEKYRVGQNAYNYIFQYNDKYYSINLYEKIGMDINMQNLNNIEYVRIYKEGESYYIDSKILKDENGSGEENYLVCNGSYSFEESLGTDCLDKDTKDVLIYMNDNLKE